MLKADLHTHTSYSHDSRMSPEHFVARCVEVGLNCVAVTDHNTIRGAQAVEQIAPFHVIIGEEVRTSEGDIIGLFLKTEVPQKLPLIETIHIIQQQGGLISLPHPYDRMRRGVATGPMELLLTLLPLADIAETFNARNVRSSYDDHALELATAHSLVPVAVSDAHTPQELGTTYVEMPDFDGTPEGFKDALTHGHLITKRASPLTHLYSTFNKLIKRFE